MADKEGITEQLKAADQMAWVGAMNNIRNRADVVVLFLSVKTGLFICSILERTSINVWIARGTDALVAAVVGLLCSTILKRNRKITDENSRNDMHPQKVRHFWRCIFYEQKMKNYFHNFSGYRPISCRCLREFATMGLSSL